MAFQVGEEGARAKGMVTLGPMATLYGGRHRIRKFVLEDNYGWGGEVGGGGHSLKEYHKTGYPEVCTPLVFG